MKFAAIAGFLAFLPLLGIAYIVFSGSLFTVDGLFMILILLTISGIFGLETLLELRGGRLVTPAGTPAGSVRVAGGAAQPGVQVASGTVRDLQFFESSVGAPNKTLVELQPAGAPAARFVTFLGNVRDQLPVGARVRLTYRIDPDGNVLLTRAFLPFGRG